MCDLHNRNVSAKAGAVALSYIILLNSVVFIYLSLTHTYTHAGFQGEEHRPHAPGHRSFAKEQQERLHLRAYRHRSVSNFPLGSAPRILQGPGGFQAGWKETHAQETHW